MYRIRYLHHRPHTSPRVEHEISQRPPARMDVFLTILSNQPCGGTLHPYIHPISRFLDVVDATCRLYAVRHRPPSLEPHASYMRSLPAAAAAATATAADAATAYRSQGTWRGRGKTTGSRVTSLRRTCLVRGGVATGGDIGGVGDGGWYCHEVEERQREPTSRPTTFGSLGPT